MTPASAVLPLRLWRVIPAIGIAQIIAWGSLYYSIAVLAGPIGRTLALGKPMIFGAFTIALVISGVLSPYAGRWIDARGGQPVLGLASVLGAGAFALIAVAQGPLVFTLGWIVAGVAMAFGLYDAAMATLNVLVPGAGYRRAVTALTLFGGFASTVFWPLTYWLNETVGWRETCILYALLHLCVCLPLYRLALPRTAVAHPHANGSAARPPHRPAAPTPSFVWLAVAFALGSFTFSVLSVHLISLLTTAGITESDAILVGALIGPMQVLARMIEFVFARELRAVTVGTIAFSLMFAALISLAFVDGERVHAFLFAALYGASNGIMTIIRGTVPAELFGRAGFGALLGRLAMPSFLAKAFAPVAFSLLLAAGLAHSHALWLLILCGASASLCFELARRQAVAADAPAGLNSPRDIH